MEKSLLSKVIETIEQHRAERRPAAPDTRSARPLARFLRWLAPNGGTILVVLALLLTQQVWARPVPQQVHVPGPSATTVNYQGRLADPAGNPLDGNYGMTFSLWDAPSGGALVWGPENHPAVPVSGGLFSVGLGSLTSGGIPTTVWNGDRYLEMIVGGETLAPRELIRAVPVAGMALTVPDGAIDTAKIEDGSVTTVKVADGAITTEKIADSAVSSSQLANGAATSAKVALTHGWVGGPGGSIPVTTDWQAVPGCSFSVAPTTNQILYVHAALDAYKPTSSGTIIGRIYLDGSPIGESIILGGDGDVRVTVSRMLPVALSPGTHSVVLGVYCESGSGGLIFTGHSAMSYILFAQ